MSTVSVTNFFPCAKADFAKSNGSHRLWTEYNITNIFNSLFDVDPNIPIISRNNNYLFLHGYLFEGSFTEGDSYYIDYNETSEELECVATENGETVLYDTDVGLSHPIGGVAQKIKFEQSSIGDIDLNQ